MYFVCRIPLQMCQWEQNSCIRLDGLTSETMPIACQKSTNSLHQEFSFRRIEIFNKNNAFRSQIGNRIILKSRELNKIKLIRLRRIVRKSGKFHSTGNTIWLNTWNNRVRQLEIAYAIALNYLTNLHSSIIITVFSQTNSLMNSYKWNKAHRTVHLHMDVGLCMKLTGLSWYCVNSIIIIIFIGIARKKNVDWTHREKNSNMKYWLGAVAYL